MNGDSSKPNGMQALEMEPLHANGADDNDYDDVPLASSQQQQQHYLRRPPGLWEQLCRFLRLYAELNPGVAGCVAAVAAVVGVWFLVDLFLVMHNTNSLERHRLHQHGYNAIDVDYDFKASQIDHWCLFGGDDSCTCQDFTEDTSREEEKGWLERHEANKQSIDDTVFYDVVLIGDDVVEGFTGSWSLRQPMGITSVDNKKVEKYWSETFTYDGGGVLEGLALGIMGDSAANLLWRLKHGELPRRFRSKVWWLSVGSNDLARGGCSEEATVLGILRITEELHAHDPDAIVVVQAILPRTNSRDGRLDEPNRSFFHPKADKMARRGNIWPSIQAVNRELFEFSEKHAHIVYFDASELVVGRMGNAHFQSTSGEIISQLMPDYVHLSAAGYKVLGDRIVKEVKRIIVDDDERNDIESKGTRE